MKIKHIMYKHYFRVTHDVYHLFILHKPSALSVTTKSDAIENPVEQRKDFSAYSGFVVFENRQSLTSIVLTPAQDGIPEYSESFFISLVNVTGMSYSHSIEISSLLLYNIYTFCTLAYMFYKVLINNIYIYIG